MALKKRRRKEFYLINLELINLIILLLRVQLQLSFSYTICNFGISQFEIFEIPFAFLKLKTLSVIIAL